jgi:hypothetical protein
MTTNTLNSPKIIGLLDRIFAQDEATESASDIVRQSDASHLITSKTGYRQFYGLLKDIPLPVSRETGSLLYMLARSTRARSIWPRPFATMAVVESSRRSSNLPRRHELAKT